LNKRSPSSSREELSKNSLHPRHGEFTPLPRQEDPISTMSIVCGAPTTKTSGSSSRSDNTLKTPQEQLPEPVLRGDRCSPSIPTSPSYFDLLYEEEEDPSASTQHLSAKVVGPRKRVSFAISPPLQVTENDPSTRTEEGDGAARETSSSLFADKAEEEATTTKATRQIGSPSYVQLRTEAPTQHTPP